MKDIFWMVSFLWEYPQVAAFIAAVVIVWWILTIIVLGKRIQQWLDGRVPPDKKEVRTRTTLPGAKLYACLKEEFRTTVLWEAPFSAIRVLLGATVLAFGVTMIWQAIRWIFDPNIGADPLAVSFGQSSTFWAILTLAAFVGVPFVCHRRRWIQRNTRLVFTTEKMILARGKIGFFQIIKLEADYYISETDLRFMDDILIAPDPQDLQRRFRTSWFRDRWTKFWARRIDVASVYIPARAYGGADFVTWLAGANTFLQFRDQLREEADLLGQARGQYKGAAVAIRSQVYHDQDDLILARQNFEEAMRDADTLLRDIAEPVEFDLFSLDSGVWPNGWGIATSEAPGSDADARRRYDDLLGPEGSTPPQDLGPDLHEDTGYNDEPPWGQPTISPESPVAEDPEAGEKTRRRRYQDLLGPEPSGTSPDEDQQGPSEATGTPGPTKGGQPGRFAQPDNSDAVRRGLHRPATPPEPRQRSGSSFLPEQKDDDKYPE